MTGDGRRRVICTVSLVAATSFAIACGSRPSVSSNAPDEDARFAHTNYAIVWSDPAGLDLMSSEGTYVRASIESLDVSAVNGIADSAAPGFWDSLTDSAKAEAEGFFDMGPAQPEYGIKRYEILEIVDDGRSTKVTVCSYNQQVGHQGSEKGTYEFGGTGPHSTVITFKTTAAAPPANQSGPETFALRPVFGSWQTTAWETGYFPGGDPCAGRPLPGGGPGSWPQTRGAGPYTTTALPREPSYPGWPGAMSM
jgi:hypothetical protein